MGAIADAAGAAKERMRVVWGMGDYSHLSRRLEPAARDLADACAVSAGQEVLDVAAGDGNFALACAREGASVIASDLAPGMVEKGRARSEREGYEIEWTEADAEELPFDDARFDCVGSVFGANADLGTETLELLEGHNAATDGTLRLDAEYLLTVARKRG